MINNTIIKGNINREHPNEQDNEHEHPNEQELTLTLNVQMLNPFKYCHFTHLYKVTIQRSIKTYKYLEQEVTGKDKTIQ